MAMLKTLPTRRNEQKLDMLKMLDDMREEVKEGKILRLGLVVDRNGAWSTEFSHSDDNRIDAAMLIELGIRRLGFEGKK